MASRLESWASTERGFIQGEIKFFENGGKLISPERKDVTDEKLQELKLRLEHINSVFSELDNAKGS